MGIILSLSFSRSALWEWYKQRRRADESDLVMFERINMSVQLEFWVKYKCLYCSDRRQKPCWMSDVVDLKKTWFWCSSPWDSSSLVSLVTWLRASCRAWLGEELCIRMWLCLFSCFCSTTIWGEHHKRRRRDKHSTTWQSRITIPVKSEGEGCCDELPLWQTSLLLPSGPAPGSECPVRPQTLPLQTETLEEISTLGHLCLVWAQGTKIKTIFKTLTPPPLIPLLYLPRSFFSRSVSAINTVLSCFSLSSCKHEERPTKTMKKHKQNKNREKCSVVVKCFFTLIDITRSFSTARTRVWNYWIVG